MEFRLRDRLPQSPPANSPQRLWTVYIGVDTSTILSSRTREEVCRELGEGEDGQILLKAARLMRHKGYPLFLRVIAWLHHEFPPLVTVIVGIGTREQAWCVLAASLRVADATRFLATRRDVADPMASSDVVGLTWDWPGFPSTILEARWPERPSVATDVGKCSEIVVGGEMGHRVPVGDGVPFARAGWRLLKDPAVAARMGVAARQRVWNRFAAGQLVDRTAERSRIAPNGAVQERFGDEAEAMGG